MIYITLKEYLLPEYQNFLQHETWTKEMRGRQMRGTQMKLLYCMFYYNIFLMTLNRVKLARLVTFIKYTASIVRLIF